MIYLTNIPALYDRREAIGTLKPIVSETVLMYAIDDSLFTFYNS